MPLDKVRIRFAKRGPLRLVSHHDIMRCLERLMRRAALPFRMTEGFHPMPRMVFALSLPLGMEGLREVLELEWTEPIEPEDALQRLQAVAPDGLDFVSAERIPLKTTARPRRACYRLPLPAGGGPAMVARCEQLRAGDEIWIDRWRPSPRQVNIRPYLDAVDCDGDQLQLALWVSQDGSARADEVARVLGLEPWLDAGAVLTRTDLELLDELPPDELARVPKLPDAQTRAAFERPLVAAGPQPELEPASAQAEWGASPNGPEVE